MFAEIITSAAVVVGFDYVSDAAKSTSRKGWKGHPIRFVVLALSLSLVLAGVAGNAAMCWFPDQVGRLGWVKEVVSAGIMLYVLANKRSCINTHHREKAPQ